MFSTKTHFKERTARLRAWRKGDRELAEAWVKDWWTLLRNPQGDHPRKATDLLFKMIRAANLPTTEMIRVFVAKGPREMQTILRKLVPSSVPHNPTFAIWPSVGLLPYSLGGVPETFCNKFFRGRWGRSTLELPWPVRLHHAGDWQRLRSDGPSDVEFDTLWEHVSAAFAEAFCARGLNLGVYKPALSSLLLLEVLRNCFDAALSSTGAWLVICRSPKTVKVDEYGVLHATSGPALEWEGDLKVFIRRGVILPPDLHDRDGNTTVTLDRIQQERNQEVRSLLVELYGEAKYIKESGFVRAGVDERGTLWRQGNTSPGLGPRIAYVQVKNASPEKDGSFREFWLPVPETVRTPTEAVGWTFQKRQGEYKPIFET